VKAGKRIYYFDVKRTRAGNELFVSITESKKIVGGTEQNPQFSFAKQKILIYREDLKNFADAVNEIIAFVEQAADSEDIEVQNQEKEVVYQEQPQTKDKPADKPAKTGNRFKAMLDDIFSDI
jgi:hypothetical protein